MGNRLRRFIPVLRSPDLALGAGVVAVAVGTLIAAGDLGTAVSAWLIALLAAICCCAGLARRHPMIAALLACPLVPGAAALDTGTVLATAQDGLLVAIFLLVYRVTTRAGLRQALTATALVTVCWQAGAIWQAGAAGFNPGVFCDTFGACGVGLIVRSRSKAHAELAARGRELALAQERYAAESVRYERTRIARELHDIVAHCVSVMVVQAGAGQKLATRDRALAAEAFDHIAESAQQAEEEIGRLVVLLERNPPPRSRSIGELVRRARATGLAISYRLDGGVGQLGPAVPDTSVSDTALSDTALSGTAVPGTAVSGTAVPGVVVSGAALSDTPLSDTAVSDAAYAVVQEALTNALKHAPGAPIEVCVRSTPSAVDVVVTNGPARTAALPLAVTGGGHGIGGMHERVSACGGTLEAFATAGGGWRIAAYLPPAPAPARSESA